MITWLLVSTALLGPPDDAAARAKAAYDRGDFETAAAALAEAYEADPQPAYLYARAQAERFGGHCDDAIVHYEAFLATKPDGKAAQAARTNLEACRADLAAAEPEPEPAPAPAPAPEPTPTSSSPEPTPAPADEAPRPWHRDPLGGALVGTGALALGVGVGLYAAAKADENTANDAADVDAYGERIERAATLSRVAIPVMAVGGALVIGGVVRWIVVARRNDRRTASRVDVTASGLAVRF
jgi:tetratricopeptide (TPR) repeat protein